MEKCKQIKEYITKNTLNLEQVVKDYNRYVHKIIENMSIRNLSNEDIEEIVSDTFFILWKNKDKLDDEKLISSYIAGITRNLVKEKIREFEVKYDISDFENQLQDVTRIEMICEEREKINLIQKSLRKMKKEDITIFNLYYYSSRKIKEISIMLNCSEFKVKTRLHRIRKKIKKDLEKGGYSYE